MGFPTRAVTMGTLSARLRTTREEILARSGKVNLWYVGCSPPSATPRQLKFGGFMSEPNRTSEEVLRRVQGEFLEMPGLRLTVAQARRLWGLDAASCDALLAALIDSGFL